MMVQAERPWNVCGVGWPLRSCRRMTDAVVAGSVGVWCAAGRRLCALHSGDAPYQQLHIYQPATQDQHPARRAHDMQAAIHSIVSERVGSRLTKLAGGGGSVNGLLSMWY